MKNNFLRIIYSKIEPSDEPPRLVKFLIKYKIARTEWQATALVFLVIVVSLSLSVIFFNTALQAQVGSF